jgi:hypothetical protein
MSVMLEDISATTARALIDQAAANGLTVEAYLQRLLGITTEVQQAVLATSSDKSLNTFMADMETLAEGTDHLPPPPVTYSREDIYFDHD